ncbi:MAG: 1-acyl-sn-glycerol-3-phosphate acyltransferase [Syntrophales bacterium]|nr:1-acyl-sn-glycerol-3-phosphate acyltransferase [Syntrophales bacterium]
MVELKNAFYMAVSKFNLRSERVINKIIVGIFFTVVAITSIPFFLIALLIRILSQPFDRRLKLLHLFTCFWASLYTWMVPAWRIRIEGREHIRKGATYVVVANHQSHLDVLVLFRLFFHFKWVSKVEIFRIPFIGWNMILNKYVKIKRGDAESVEQMMAACERHLEEGSSVLLFPEGTRSPDGEIKKFKLGAFRLALRKRVSILPIIISGTHKALPKYKIDYTGVHRIYVKIFEEIPYSMFEKMSPEELAHTVRSFMVKKLIHVNARLAMEHD